MSQETLVAATIVDVALEPIPVPDEDIVAGSPVVKGHVLYSSPDYHHNIGVWESTPATYWLPHDYDETVTIVSGSATVTPEDGAPVTLRAGDVAHFVIGTRVLWEIHETLRKSFNIHDPTGKLFAP